MTKKKDISASKNDRKPAPDEHSKTSWGGVAPWYDQTVERNDSYQHTLILPNLLRLLDLQAGERVLDEACGQGLFAREFAKAGAVVVGTDISPELIEIAKGRSRGLKVDYQVAPAGDQKNISDNDFDKAACVLALQDMDDMNAAFKETRRVLKPGGLFFVVINHPAYRIPKRSAWEVDQQKKIQYRRVDEYMSEARVKIDVHPGSTSSPQAGSTPSTGSGQGGSPQAGSTHSTGSGQAGSTGSPQAGSTGSPQVISTVSPQRAHTTYFHRPLQSYFKGLEKAGFVVVRLEEWVSNRESEPGPAAVMENKARREFPLFMAIVAKKM